MNITKGNMLDLLEGCRLQLKVLEDFSISDNEIPAVVDSLLSTASNCLDSARKAMESPSG